MRKAWIIFFGAALLLSACQPAPTQVPQTPGIQSQAPTLKPVNPTPLPASPQPQVGQPPLAPTLAPAQRPYALGISLEANSYSSRAFANILKNDARVWVPDTMNPGAVDENGMPTSDFDLFTLDGAFLHETSGFNGTYTLYFNGTADLNASGGTLQNQQYDATQNLTTARLLVNDPYPTVILYFRNTRRTPQSSLNSGVTGLKLMRPVRIGGSESYPPEAVFTTEYLELHNRGQVLRLMDFTATNGNIQREWQDRNTPEDLTFYGEAPGYWWQGKGAPWEYAILLANTLDKDIWVNIPTFASDDYVAHLADLLYTSLEPERNIYIEYSNEIWNFSFPQWEHVSQLVDADLASNPQTSINFDGAVKPNGGETDYGVGVPRYWARRVMEISDIFRARFGDEAMLTRVRPLFETQAAWQHWIANGLLFLDRYYNNADGIAHVSNPRPVNAYLWGGGGSGYIHGMPDGLADKPNLSVDDVFAAYEQAWPEHYRVMSADVHWLAAFGLKRVAYEAGPGLDDFAGKESPLQQAQIDPRMESVYRRAADTFFQAGGDLYVTFLGVNLSHGLLPFDAVRGTQPTPKLNAFDAMLAAAERPTPTVGYAVPSVIPGGRYHVREDGWSVGESDDPVRLESDYAWVSYTIHTPSQAEYSILLNTANSVNAQANIWVDGVAIVGGLPCPNGGETVPVSVTLTPGVHAIRIQVTSGSFDLNTVSIEPKTP
ncbi:MAG: hypothetical protein Fur0016_15120 [Anaerolineales bacterium]